MCFNWCLVLLTNENHEKDAELFFKEHEEKMLAGTKVLWEAKNFYYKLMCIKVSEGDASFFSEYQDEPINPEDCLFQEDWFDYYNSFEMDFSGEEFEFFSFVDPSLGKSKKSDFSAIITIAKSRRTAQKLVATYKISKSTIATWEKQFCNLQNTHFFRFILTGIFDRQFTGGTAFQMKIDVSLFQDVAFGCFLLLNIIVTGRERKGRHAIFIGGQR